MKWTIKTRLITGCVVLLVVIAIACSFGLHQMSSAEHSISDITGRSTINIKRLDAAQEAKAGLLSARRFDTEFRLSKQLPAMAEVHQALAATRASLQAITADVTENDVLNAPVKAALASADKYEASVNRLAELLTKRGLTPEQGVEGELRKSVHTVEALVNEQGLAELSVLMLMCRRHEKDYLLRGDPKYLGEIAKRIEEFDAQMKQFSLPADVQGKATAAWKEYYANMRAIVEIDSAVKAAVTEADARRTR